MCDNQQSSKVHRFGDAGKFVYTGVLGFLECTLPNEYIMAPIASSAPPIGPAPKAKTRSGSLTLDEKAMLRSRNDKIPGGFSSTRYSKGLLDEISRRSAKTQTLSIYYGMSLIFTEPYPTNFEKHDLLHTSYIDLSIMIYIYIYL